MLTNTTLFGSKVTSVWVVLIVLMKSESFRPCIDSNRNTTFNAKKGSKDIVKLGSKDIIGSTVILWRYKNTFECKETITSDFIKQFILFHVKIWHAFTKLPHMLRRSRCCGVEQACAVPCLQAEECTRMRRVTLACVLKTGTEEKNCRIKSIFVFFLHTKIFL